MNGLPRTTRGRNRARAAAAVMLERQARRSGRAVGVILMYHDVGEVPGDPTRDIVPTLDAGVFAAELEQLRRGYEVVPLQELRGRMRARTRGERLPVALTFDDDLSSHAQVVAPLLSQMEMPATFFLTGRSLERPAPFWWQDLQKTASLGGDVLTRLRAELAESWPWARVETRVHDLAHTIEQLPPADREAVARVISDHSPRDQLDVGLPTDAVRRLVDRGFEIGFHTLHHHPLPALHAEELRSALRDGVETLARAAGRDLTAIAYPHCRADLRVAHAAQEAGFELGVVCSCGPVAEEQNPLLLDRWNGWSASVEEFSFQLARATAKAA